MFRTLVSALNLVTERLIERFDPKLWLVRLLMAAMFLESGLDKLLHWSNYQAEVAAHHIPMPSLALLMAMAIELVGSAALLANFALAPALLALAVYTIR